MEPENQDSRPQRSPGDTIRDLMRRLPRVGLGTIDRASGEPYVSLAMTALGHDAAPLLLISDLADHTKNIRSDARVSLLFDATIGHESPLSGARASVQGTARPCTGAKLMDRYVARHPDAAIYRDFKDFNLFRVEVERAHLVAGFGRIHWVDKAQILIDVTGFEALAEAEGEIVTHMNEDHGDAVALYATVLLNGREGHWTMTGLDPEGADLRLDGDVRRLVFDKVVKDAEQARVELVRLVKRARRIRDDVGENHS